VSSSSADGSPNQAPATDRLDSWKDIAAYLRRDVSTVQRWERREGMPVRRHFHRKTASVYAYRSDIDEWWQRRDLRLVATSEHDGQDLPAGVESGARTALSRHSWRMPATVAGVVLASVVALAIVDWPDRNPSTPTFAIDPSAYQEYVVGRYHLSKQNEDDLVLAIRHFEQAAKIEPKYAAAYAALSEAWWARGIWGGQTLGHVESASRAAAQKALASNPALVEARVSLGRIRYTYDWDWAGAEADFRQALAIDPDNRDAHYSYAMLLMGLGRFAESIDHVERAAQLDPSSSMVQSGFGRVLYRARRYDDAIDHLRRAIALEPRNYGAFNRLGDVYAVVGRYDEALNAYDDARKGFPGPWGHLARQAYVYALMGRTREARQMLEDLKHRRRTPLWDGAKAYAALGDRDKAFELLFRAIDEPSRNELLFFVKEDPAFDSLHQDVQWKPLLDRLNLAPAVDEAVLRTR
jgi:tetratricopeptide (TPR) repeat protein